MVLPKGHRLTSLLFLTARGPANTKAPGLQGNKNGPPGPEGNQKGPLGTVISTEELASPTIQAPPLKTKVTSSDNPPSASDAPAALITTSTSTRSPLTLSSVIVTSVIPTSSTNLRTSSVPATTSVPNLTLISTPGQPSPSSPGTPTSLTPADSGTVRGTVTSATPSMESLATPSVSASSDGFSTSAKYSVSGSPSSSLSDTLVTIETTLQTTFTYTISATAIQTGMTYPPQNGTAQSEYSAALPSEKAGVAVGTIAGFAFILTLIFLLFKCRRSKLLKPPPNAEAGSSHSLGWNYQATFSRPPVIERLRQSLRKSLTGLLQDNPLGLNPVKPQATGARTTSRKSFASLFQLRSAASTRQSAFCPSLLRGQSGSMIDPQSSPPLPPPYAALPSPRPSDISGRSEELAQSYNDDSPKPLTIPPQFPLQSAQLPWYHRDSQITLVSAETESRSIQSVPSWVNFHCPHRLCSSGKAPEESEKALPLSPLVCG